VSTGDEFLDEVGHWRTKFANQEKSGAGVVPGQQFQKFRGDRGIGPSSKVSANFAAASVWEMTGPEKMRAGVGRAVGGHGRRRRRRSRKGQSARDSSLVFCHDARRRVRTLRRLLENRGEEFHHREHRGSQREKGAGPRLAAHKRRERGCPKGRLEVGIKLSEWERPENFSFATVFEGTRCSEWFASASRWGGAPLRTETLIPGENKSMKAVARIFIPAMVFVLFFALSANSTFAQGRHPAYLHALSDLRTARAHLQRPTGVTYATKKKMPYMNR